MGDYVNENHHGIRVLGHKIGAGAVIKATGALADALDATPGVRTAKAGERKAYEAAGPGAYKPPAAPPSGLVTAHDVDPAAALAALGQHGRVRDGVETAVLQSVGPTGGGVPAFPDAVIAQSPVAIEGGTPLPPGVDLSEAERPVEPEETEEERIAKLTALYEADPWRAEELDGYTIAELQGYASEHDIHVPSSVTKRDDIQAYIETKRTEV